MIHRVALLAGVLLNAAALAAIAYTISLDYNLIHQVILVGAKNHHELTQLAANSNRTGAPIIARLFRDLSIICAHIAHPAACPAP